MKQRKEFQRRPVQPTLFDIPSSPAFALKQLARAREIVERIPEPDLEQQTA